MKVKRATLVLFLVGNVVNDGTHGIHKPTFFPFFESTWSDFTRRVLLIRDP